MIIDKLIEAIIKKNNATVVGLDPKLEYIPQFLKNKYFEKFGETKEAVCAMFLEFNKSIIDEIFDIVPAVKPQIAMYEQYGYEGIKCYEETIDYAKQKGLIVIGDIKRGDIASTAESYSVAHLGKVKINNKELQSGESDFITVNPYMGYDSIEPYEREMEKYNKGLFVLVRTSNKMSFQIQNLELKDGKKVYEEVGSLTEKWGDKFLGKYGYSSIGAVVGATQKEEIEILRSTMKKTFFLVPGYGAQGATGEDIKICFDEKGLGAIVNSSRGIICAYKNEKYKNKFDEKNYAKASRQSVIDMKKDLNKYRF